MPKLYTYCIPIDDGAAPNPYWGICTLAICKPAIRRTASVGDWIVGTGSAGSSSGDIRHHVVYAMRVSQKMTMAEYDTHTRKVLRNKIPNWKDSDVKRRLGDSIYDFSTSPPILRESVHDLGNMKGDLSGENVLLSDNYYYFGNESKPLPESLWPIIKGRQGHRVHLNQPFLIPFLQWLKGLNLEPNRLLGEPGLKLFEDADKYASAKSRAECAQADEGCGHD